MIDFLNWGGECLLRGTPWFFVLDRMRFVFKGLTCLQLKSLQQDSRIKHRTHTNVFSPEEQEHGPLQVARHK
jgi:hypothetical protein